MLALLSCYLLRLVLLHVGAVLTLHSMTIDCVAQQGGPLLALQPPVLFISGSSDDLCNLTHLRQICVEMQSSDIRFVVMKVSDILPRSAVL